MATNYSFEHVALTRENFGDEALIYLGGSLGRAVMRYSTQLDASAQHRFVEEYGPGSTASGRANALQATRDTPDIRHSILYDPQTHEVIGMTECALPESVVLTFPNHPRVRSFAQTIANHLPASNALTGWLKGRIEATIEKSAVTRAANVGLYVTAWVVDGPNAAVQRADAFRLVQREAYQLARDNASGRALPPYDERATFTTVPVGLPGIEAALMSAGFAYTNETETVLLRRQPDGQVSEEPLRLEDAPPQPQKIFAAYLEPGQE